MVDLMDVTEAAAIILTRTDDAGAIYELCGAEVLTQLEVAAILAQTVGQPVQAETIALDTWQSDAISAGLGEYQIDTLCKMFRYYEQYGFWGNATVLEMLLGRKPTTFAEFVQRQTESL